MFNRSMFFVFLMQLVYSSTVGANDFIQPNPAIRPSEVIAIQLNSLKNNDQPHIDAGIRQTWKFAHPRNKAMTGPFPLFLNMLKSPHYKMMLNHNSHKIKLITSGNGWQKFEVLMESANGNVMQFLWVVEMVTNGDYKDCWMTVSVSAPRLSGQGS